MYDSILIDYGLEKFHKYVMANSIIDYPSIHADPSTLTEEQRVLQEKLRCPVEQLKIDKE